MPSSPSSANSTTSGRISQRDARLIARAGDYLDRLYQEWKKWLPRVAVADACETRDIRALDLELLRSTVKAMRSMGRHSVRLDVDQIRMCSLLRRLAVTFSSERRPGFGQDARGLQSTTRMLQRRTRKARAKSPGYRRWAPVARSFYALAHWRAPSDPTCTHGEKIKSGRRYLDWGVEMAGQAVRAAGCKPVPERDLRREVAKENRASRRNKWGRGLFVIVNDPEVGGPCYLARLKRAGLLERVMPPKPLPTEPAPAVVPPANLAASGIAVGPARCSAPPRPPEEPAALEHLRNWRSWSYLMRAYFCRICMAAGWSRRQIARAIGVSEGAVRHWLRLGAVPAEYQRLLDDGMSARSVLQRYRDDEAQKELFAHLGQYIGDQTGDCFAICEQVLAEAVRFVAERRVLPDRSKPYTWKTLVRRADRLVRPEKDEFWVSTLGRRVGYIVVNGLPMQSAMAVLLKLQEAAHRSLGQDQQDREQLVYRDLQTIERNVDRFRHSYWAPRQLPLPDYLS